MKKFENSQLYSIGGVVFMLLAIMLPFIKISVPMFGRGTAGLDMGLYMLNMGNVHWLMYLIFILGLAIFGYCTYATFFERTDFFKPAIACAGYFVILIITYFIVKSKFGEVERGLSEFISMSFSIFAPLFAALCYYLTTTALVKEKAGQ